MAVVDAVEPADGVACQDEDVHDARNDARYDTHVHDVVPADAVHQAAVADAVVRADAVVAVRMQIPLISGIYMRICIFSYHACAKAVPRQLLIVNC